MKALKKRPVHMKYPQHLNLAKGGAVVQKFAVGGPAVSPIVTQAQPLSTPPPPNPIQSVPSVLNPDLRNPAQAVGNVSSYAGGIAKNLASNLTVQNQFQATGAPITPGTNTDQLNTAYTGAQGGLEQQQNIANTLTPGVAQGAGSQANLTGMLTNQANGQGPNPAQAQLNQATGANVAAQAALMAGQRGASANVGQIARQAAQQGAATQQQAVGQGAALEAQQQIAAEQNLQNLAANQVAQGTAAVQGVNNAQQNEQNILQGANTAYNSAQVAQQSNLNTVNAGVAQQNANAENKTIGGLESGLSSIASIFADGGAVTGEKTSAPNSYGGAWLSSTPASAPIAEASPASGPSSESPSDSGSGVSDLIGSFKYSGGKIAKGPHRSHVANFLAGGGATGVKAIVSPKEVYLSPDQVHKVIHEGADPIKIGHHFPGQDRVRGRDSKKNDVIPTTLQDGGCVLPVHITTHKDASQRGRKFVVRTMAKHMKKPAGMN